MSSSRWMCLSVALIIFFLCINFAHQLRQYCEILTNIYSTKTKWQLRMKLFYEIFFCSLWNSVAQTGFQRHNSFSLKCTNEYLCVSDHVWCFVPHRTFAKRWTLFNYLYWISTYIINYLVNQCACSGWL